jgi:hypothetical protein
MNNTHTAAAHTIRATHANGYIKAAFVRHTADVPSTIAALEDAGYWLNISVEPFTPKARRAA